MCISYKRILLLLLIIVIICLVFFYKLGLSFSFKNVYEIKNSRVENKDLIKELKINGIDAIYDKNNNVFYYNISDKYKSSKYVLNLNLDNYKYILPNHKTNIIKVDYNQNIDVIIYDDQYYYETKIIITNLPLISINTDEEITVNDINSDFKFINNSSKQRYINGNIKIHIRGASSLALAKKSYRINFYDDTYSNKANIHIRDFYYDNSFILLSVYRDPSKIRDNLATHLWNDISNDFKDSNVNSKYVELFINNEYEGLYIFTEAVNRKNLNVSKKTGIVVKTNSWETLDPNDNFGELDKNTYAGYEIKYPNDETLYNKVWISFLNRIRDYYDPNVDNDYSVISNTFNINNYIDMIIFNSFTNNVDSSMIKNLYFYMNNYDDLIYIEPWDLEFTFGFAYDEQSLNHGKFIDDDEIPAPLFTYDEKINKLIVKRYKSLRKNILTKEYFDNLLDKYLVNLEYASKRDSEAGQEYNLKEEIERIRTWINIRLEVLDEEVKKHE